MPRKLKLSKKMKMPKLSMPKMPKMPSVPALLKNKLFLTVLAVLVLAVIAIVIWGNLPTNRENFDANSSNPVVALFYAPWCGHCKKLKPIWQQVEDANPGTAVSVNCDDNPDMAKKFGVQGFPTIKFCPNGLSSPQGVEEFNGERTFEEITKYVNDKVKPTPDPTSENPMPTDGSQPPVDLAGAGVKTVSFVGRNILPNA